MKIVILYETVLGNTRRVASAIADGAEQVAAIRVISVEDRWDDVIAGADALVAGAPTHAFGLTMAATRGEAVRRARDRGQHLDTVRDEPTTGMREWLAASHPIPHLFASFDTKAESMRHWPGSAARRIDKTLRSRGAVQLCQPESFFVTAQDTLSVGEEERARSWGEALAQLVAREVAASSEPG